MTTPSPQTEPPPDDTRLVARRQSRRARDEAFARWSKRGTWVGYATAAVVFVVTVAITMDMVPEWSILLSLLAAVAGMVVMITMVYPRLPQPAVPCPDCARRVPIAEAPTQPFAAIRPLDRCPHCGADLLAPQ